MRVASAPRFVKRANDIDGACTANSDVSRLAGGFRVNAGRKIHSEALP